MSGRNLDTKQQPLMKKLYFFLLPVLTIVGLVMYKNCHGKTLKKRTLTYDKAHVEKLRDFTGYKNLDEFKKVGEIEHLQVTFLECWEGEAGDFRKVQIKLQNGRIVEYDNSDGWIKFTEPSEPLAITLADIVKIPEDSSKIQAHRYGITLDMGKGNWILMLFGYPYANDAGLLTLIDVSKDHAEIIFNKEVDVLEITETAQGYRLVSELDPGKIAGNTNSRVKSTNQRCEIDIEDGKLVFNVLKTDEPIKHQERKEVTKGAVCNIGVCKMFNILTGSNELDDKSANEMIDHWVSSANWEEIPMSRAHALVNEGNIIAAGAKTGPQGINGHVVMLVPGQEGWSKNWECNVPMAMDTGKGKRWSANRLSYSFCKKDKEHIKFFLYKGSIYK